MEHPSCFCCFVVEVSLIFKSSQTITFLQNDIQGVASYFSPYFFSDSSYFHLPALSTDNGSQSTVFGVSCFKQIDSKVCLLYYYNLLLLLLLLLLNYKFQIPYITNLL